MLAGRALSLAAALLPATPARGSDLIVVDSLGGGDATQITDAIALAQDGDTILVRPWALGPPGYYEGFAVSALGLRIVPEPGAEIATPWVRVSGLGPHQSVLLSGVHAKGSILVPRLQLTDDVGSVRVEGCRFEDTSHGGGVYVERCLDVALVGCRVWAAEGPGIACIDSRLALHDSYVIGGVAPDHLGAAGVSVSRGFVWSAVNEIWGGTGADNCGEVWGYEGGPGVQLADHSQWISVGNDVHGGFGGYYGWWIACGDVAESGPDHDVEPGSTLEEKAVSPRRLQVLEPVVVEGGALSLSVHGAAGDEALLFRSLEPAFTYRPELVGVAHLAQLSAQSATALGTIPADGWFGSVWEVPSLSPGLDAITVHLQVLTVEPTGRRYLSGPASVTIHRDLGWGPGRLFVDADAIPGGDGKSWATAYDRLEDALAEAQVRLDTHPFGHLEIWVAEGTYVAPPTNGGFVVRGARVYGGFAGGESALDERDWVAHPCRLSGDVLGDDTPGFGHRDDNRGELVRMLDNSYDRTNPPVLDGFVITGAQNDGGGWVSPVRAEGVLRNCRFFENFSHIQAGAVEADGWYGPVAVQDCVFERNVCADGAGALKTVGSVGVQGCTFLGNEGTLGGAVGVVAVSGADTLLAQSLFVGNRSSGPGGAVVVTTPDTGRLRVTGCTAHANEADSGGAVSIGADVMVEVADSILWGNSDSLGGGEYSQVWSELGGDVRLDYCCIEGFATLPGVGNHGLDPLFVDPLGTDGVPGTGDEDLHLGPGSPCADHGSNLRIAEDDADLDGDGLTWEALPLDLDGLPRRVDDPTVQDRGEGQAPIVDMGVYERQ